MESQFDEELNTREWWNNLDKYWKIYLNYTIQKNTNQNPLKLLSEPNNQQLKLILELEELFFDDEYQAIQQYLKEKYSLYAAVSNTPIREHLYEDQDWIFGDEELNILNRQSEQYKAESEELENWVVSLVPLSRLTNLRELGLQQNRHYSDFHYLANLKKLEVLFCTNTNLKSLEPLQNLVNLRELFVWDTEIDDLSPLQNLQNLKVLDCRDTNVNNLKPLGKIVNLQELLCYGTDVNLTEIEQFKEAHPHCRIVA